MINKNSFVKIVNGLVDYWTKLSELESTLNVYFESNWMTDIVDNTLDALFDDLEIDTCPDDDCGLIFEFVIDYEVVQAGNFDIEVNGVKYTIKNAEDLYDVLIKLKEDNNNEQ
jgi:hypothetical protein